MGIAVLEWVKPSPEWYSDHTLPSTNRGLKGTSSIGGLQDEFIRGRFNRRGKSSQLKMRRWTRLTQTKTHTHTCARVHKQREYAKKIWRLKIRARQAGTPTQAVK